MAACMLDPPALIIIGRSRGCWSPWETLTPEVLANLKHAYEHFSNHAWRLGRPEEDSARSEWAWPVPVVLAGSTGPALHFLLGLLRTRVEVAVSARVLAGADI